MSETPIIDRARTAEQLRLQQSRDAGTPWKLWGPYLSERQWRTVREDYSENGDAWGYFSHDQARSRAYHWGEDGVAGFSDDKQRLCFALALWNGKDPILKERMFGLTNSEGNHGEDVKEYYFYSQRTTGRIQNRQDEQQGADGPQHPGKRNDRETAVEQHQDERERGDREPSNVLGDPLVRVREIARGVQAVVGSTGEIELDCSLRSGIPAKADQGAPPRSAR